MSRIVYVNGEYLDEQDAKISVFDRGFLFADGVYEVSPVLNGKLVENDGHLKRLERSLDELDMASPGTAQEIEAIQMEVIRRNNITEGLIYLQVTRGAADRDFPFPKDIEPSLVMFTQERSVLDNPTADTGISVVTVPDIRWQRRDIKTVGLLAQAMAKQAALNAGANDAWMVEDGFITEGSSNNAFIVTKEGKLVTRDLSNKILNGITRRSILEIARREGIEIEERAFTPEEAYEAVEAFSTSASSFAMPVTKIDDRILSNGGPGELSAKIRKLYIEMVKESVAD